MVVGEIRVKFFRFFFYEKYYSLPFTCVKVDLPDVDYPDKPTDGQTDGTDNYSPFLTKVGGLIYKQVPYGDSDLDSNP